jgi:hypothetical protein
MMTAAKKDTPKPDVKAVTQPQPAQATPAPVASAPVATAPPQPAPSKQQMTLMRLSVELAKRNVTVKPEMLKMDGKYLVLNIGEAWPEIRIGNGGGIDLPQIKSYAKAFDAAVNGDELMKKQNARLQKTTAPATTTKPAAPKPEEKKAAETVTAKKAKQDTELEQKLEQRA